jgi:hypothetical protein
MVRPTWATSGLVNVAHGVAEVSRWKLRTRASFDRELVAAIQPDRGQQVCGRDRVTGLGVDADPIVSEPFHQCGLGPSAHVDAVASEGPFDDGGGVGFFAGQETVGCFDEADGAAE